MQNPIYPSVLHVPKRVRCKFPYNADPETDELTVQFGEILVVHQESEPEWIWAESLLTGKHGAVFADLIEPLDEESDPLLGTGSKYYGLLKLRSGPRTVLAIRPLQYNSIDSRF